MFGKEMTQDSIREFVTENFGKNYYPVYHGRSNIVAPLVLIVKRKRKWWKRPFGKAEMILLASLENYMETNAKKLFHNVFQTKIQKENKSLVKTEVTEVGSNFEMLIEGFDSGEVALKTSDTPGDLELGNLTEEYFLDPDLRDLLSVASLNPDKMKPLEGHHLILVTGVIYSTKFVLSGPRKHQTTVSGNVHAPSKMAAFLDKNLWIKGQVTNTKVFPPMVNRNSRAPFLFKFCQVVYDRENKKLCISDGEFVGKTMRGEAPKQPDYEEAMMHLEMEEDLSHDPITLTDEDCERVENIKELLRTEKSGPQRKNLVQVYLHRFEKILTEEITQLSLESDRPLTRSDCEFLLKLGIRARPRQRFLRVTPTARITIQDYGILFELLSGLPEDQWKEFEATIDDTKGKDF
ncbi:PREDICTED: uncharacterized protein LOC107348504 isoform X1 [Acropora digitifera]|uniref:uncharacterized protein LOC107348504 isoform X1 n=2 Tax=Acropora digitifera TaxID=70779 RepID=UPI00077AEF4D|nr:PREDICTED: uncharacterized protein LOC107348504 isoform X1 [Acropora digitifera]